jgi:hypothetical protein
MRTYARSIALEAGKTKVGAWHIVEKGKPLCSTDITPRDTGIRTIRAESTTDEPSQNDRQCRLCAMTLERHRHPAVRPPRHAR